jgi:hypothetical protein
MVGDPTYADAILDRLIHNAYRLDLKGKTLRPGVEPGAGDAENIVTDETAIADG